jgi:hypothetical protein
MKGPNEIKTAREVPGVRGIPKENEIKAARPPKPIRETKAPCAPKPRRRDVSKRERVKALLAKRRKT